MKVEYDAEEFDARLGTPALAHPGLHRVGRVVRATERATILPPDLFRQVEADLFWRDPALNLSGVRVV
jgi:sulfotransferase